MIETLKAAKRAGLDICSGGILDLRETMEDRVDMALTARIMNNVVLPPSICAPGNMPVKGIIFNHFHAGDVMEEGNIRMCESMTRLPVLACVKDGDTELAMDAGELAALYEEGEKIV